MLAVLFCVVRAEPVPPGASTRPTEGTTSALSTLAALDVQLDGIAHALDKLGARLGRSERTEMRLRALLGRLSVSRPSSLREPTPNVVYNGECGISATALSRMLCNCTPVSRSQADAARLARMEERYGFDVPHAARNLSHELLERLRSSAAIHAGQPNDRLSPALCARMLFQDPRHHFHAMFGVPRVKSGPLCMPSGPLLPQWVADMQVGAMCDRNWYEGSRGCGSQGVLPRFGADGPALLGHDSEIIRTCNQLVGCGRSRDAPAPQTCIHANVRILALFGRNPSYNMCRNLEWVVCAAQGKLAGQAKAHLLFDPAPSSLLTAPLWADALTSAYSMRSVYYLETCILATLCANSEALFSVGPHEPFVCDFVPSALPRLVSMLARRRS